MESYYGSFTMTDTSYHPPAPIDEVSTERLLFDLENPRFVDASEALGREDQSTIRFFYEQVDLSELIQSISEVGFIEWEPLLVLPKDENYIVLEGNRRLAAIKLFKDEALQRELGLTLPSLTPQQMATLNTVRVCVMSSREDARAYIGFKHINGPHKWDSFAKAKYAAKWFQEGGDLGKISRTLGDTHNTVRRLLNGWFVLEQAKNSGFDIEGRTNKRFAFSHLYTALPRPGYRSWLGLPISDPMDPPRPNPVAANKTDNLLVLMSWLYGQKANDETPLIRTQNPDLNKLNDVLQKTDARTLLLERRDLDEAFELVDPPIRRFEGALVQAAKFAGEALALSEAYDGDPVLLETGRRLVKTSKNLVTLMEQSDEQE